MGLLRSEEILHLKIRLPGDIEASVRVMDAFGKLGIDAIQFIDLTKDDIEAKKNFAPMIKRCDDMEIKINNFLNFAKEFHQHFFSYSLYDNFIRDLDHDIQQRNVSPGTYFDIIEGEILETERRIMELVDSYSSIKEDLTIELEKKMVLEKYFSITMESNVIMQNSLSYIMGVISATDALKMNRMVIRCSRGRAMTTFFDFEYPPNLKIDFITNSKTQRKIFIIIYPSEGKEVLFRKLIQICDLFAASRYQPPDNPNKQQILSDLTNTIKEKKDYLLQAENSIRNYLLEVSGNENKPGKLDLYRLYFKKERLIYTNLNKCLLRENFIDGEVWLLSKYKERLLQILNSNSANDDIGTKGSFIDLKDEPLLKKPTYIYTNEFLYPFQQIVNTYGIPRYLEINPAYFNVVTFPFLFGVMYGDIGHGLFLLAFSLYLCWYNEDIKRNKHESLLSSLVTYRYFFLLLSLSSVFCGFIYNDFLSIPIPLFGSCYSNQPHLGVALRESVSCVYPFGFDPKWYVANNELAFFNSFKMKFSVIFGIIHMCCGIVLKGCNELFFGNMLSFILEFIPQLLFMLFLFGYMILMIFVKWSINWELEPTNPPSLITLMVNILIKKGSVGGQPLWGDEATQEQFHFGILILCVVLFPIMLIPKPIIEYRRYKAKKTFDLKGINAPLNMNNNGNNSDGIMEENSSNDYYYHISQVKIEVDDIPKTFMDFFITQAIDTIEFILSTVSNTASYLRLWALSLAHVELTKVFFDKTMHNTIMEGDYLYGLGFIWIFIGYFLWANVTFFVLICMDFMECFLHTLRLHWVEFQNKFYKADGFIFEPFSFKYIVDKANNLF